MLKPCPECKRDVSDQAESCPHCGHPLKLAVAAPPAQPKRASPIFLVLGVLTFVLLLFTPRILLVMPMLATLACVAISLVRRESGRIGAVLLGAAAFGLYFFSGVDMASLSAGTRASTSLSAYDEQKKRNAAALSQAEVVKFTWVKDRNFGGKGAIKWNVQVKNNGQTNMRQAKVEFTTYDKQGSMVSTTFTYVSAIPPGGTRADASYADLYGTEVTANAKVVEVSLEN